MIPGEYRMLIAAGSASHHVARELSKLSGAPLLDMEIKRFPDGECYVRVLDDVTGEKVVVVNTAYPDENIVETLLIQDAARDEAVELATIVPYLAYSRQDKKFKPGESLSARAMIRSLSGNSDYFAITNLHKASVMEYSGCPGLDLDTYRIIADYLGSLEHPPDMVVGPDKGARHIAESVGSMLGSEWDHLEKHRIDGETVEIAPANASVEGKTVAIVDDIIATGGTIATATSRLKDKGAVGVYAICTHGLFTGAAREKLKVCDVVASSDSIETEFSQFSVAPALTDFLKKIGFLEQERTQGPDSLHL